MPPAGPHKQRKWISLSKTTYQLGRTAEKVFVGFEDLIEPLVVNLGLLDDPVWAEQAGLHSDMY